MEVRISREAHEQLNDPRLSALVRDRVLDVIDRLEKWPQVSGVKWLTGGWAHHARIRIGITASSSTSSVTTRS